MLWCRVIFGDFFGETKIASIEAENTVISVADGIVK
jgi:hypothetical protein